MKKQNSIDLLVDNLASQFSNIKNFELTQNDPMGNKFFNFIVKHSSELEAFKNLFVHYYLPASIKSSQDFSRELKFSKYKNLIKINADELKENYFETIRLGYVGAFHKYETYIKSISKLMDEFFLDLFDENDYQNIEPYLKENFNLELKKTINNFPASEKINWIANCVKHYDGYPVKQPVLHSFNTADKNEKIKIEAKEFREDLDNLIRQNQTLLSALFLVGFHQFSGQEQSNIKEQLSEGKTEEDVKAVRSKLEESIKFLFNI